MLNSFLDSLIDNGDLYTEALGETAAMVGYSLFFSTIIGLFLGVCLVVLRPNHIYANKTLYHLLNTSINIVRSVPFIIILIAIIPITKWLVHTTIGVKGAIVPLVFYTAPYIARLIESALLEVNPGVIEAFQAMGASRRQIIWKVILKEARPGIVLGLTIATIGLIGATAMAGVMGAGGLGDVAIRYGYQRWEPDVMYVCVIILILLVQLMQSLGNRISKKLRKH
ncbi:methionine ABC transporter permease [Paenibacillus sp. PL91]|uniref:methionine ABC transporter permease n=1 Tax=Paenibacillus sp. PL91 TaxID=2729538 RepID=UPI00145D03D8|nr:methionine ABC transporter permease [Paenibacillus sp. PL91]MBC9202742.1 ABC transporter permease [Paenibacillus sp. PL91]